MKSHGQIGFEAYTRSTGGKTYDGKTIPLWTSLPTSVSKAWEDAAGAIVDASKLPRTEDER